MTAVCSLPWCVPGESGCHGDHWQPATYIASYAQPGTRDKSIDLGVGPNWTEIDGYPPLVGIHLTDGADLDRSIDLDLEHAIELRAALDDAIAKVRQAAPAPVAGS